MTRPVKGDGSLIGQIHGPRASRAASRRVWAVSVTSVVCLLVSCSRDPPEPARSAQPAVPVSVAKTVKKTMPVHVQAVGTITAYATVSVQAQVSGELLKVHFQDGQYVKTGDPLFSIDARLFQAQLDQALANHAKDQAQLQNARTQLKRNAAVVEKGYVSQEQYDQAVATEATQGAAVKADEAAIETARLHVQYCSIRSPIDGVAGAVLIDVGNIVKANDAGNPLVVINQIQPIYVTFYVPQKYLPRIREYLALGKLPVTATIPGYEETIPQGELTFVDNTINTSAGTIQLRATFANEDRVLWPGQFVETVLTLTSEPDVVVVPSQAVQTGQKGTYVFVVKPDMTVEYRSVEVQMTVDDESVISKGVQAGEKVVTDGQLRLTDGSSVKIVRSLAREGQGS